MLSRLELTLSCESDWKGLATIDRWIDSDSHHKAEWDQMNKSVIDANYFWKNGSGHSEFSAFFSLWTASAGSIDDKSSSWWEKIAEDDDDGDGEEDEKVPKIGKAMNNRNFAGDDSVSCQFHRSDEWAKRWRWFVHWLTPKKQRYVVRISVNDHPNSRTQ